MAKIMLVEDDNNLREIYEARLLAEGYEIVSAHDGEEALALAIKEKPDLIISDIMMPKISGFDMLDILRGTPETKNTKVIMMTALSQAEDRTRAGNLGADRYLVKSQVTLEDVARVAKEVLEGAVVPASEAAGNMNAPLVSSPSPTPDPAVQSISTPTIAVPTGTDNATASVTSQDDNIADTTTLPGTDDSTPAPFSSTPDQDNEGEQTSPELSNELAEAAANLSSLNGEGADASTEQVLTSVTVTS